MAGESEATATIDFGEGESSGGSSILTEETMETIGDEGEGEEEESEEQPAKPAPKGKKAPPAKKPAAKKKAAPKKPAKEELDPDVHDEDAEEEPAKGEGELEEPEEEEEETEGEEDEDGASATKGKAKGEEEEDEASEEDNDFEVEIEGEVDGKPYKEKVTLERLSRAYQLEKASFQRFEAAAGRQKALDARDEYFRRDPFGMLLQLKKKEFLGVHRDPRVAAEKAREWVIRAADEIVAPVLEEAQLPPHVREKRKIEREIAELEAERGRLLKAQEDERNAALTEAFIQKRRVEIRKAIDAAGETYTKELSRRIDERIWEYKDRGVRISARDALDEIKRERESYLKGYLPTATVDELLKLHPGLAERIRTADLQMATDEQERALRGEDGVPEDEELEEEHSEDRPAPKKRKRKRTYGSWDELERDADRSGIPR